MAFIWLLVAYGCLLFAAIFRNASTKSRTTALMVYIVLQCLYAVTGFIVAILICLAWEDKVFTHHEQSMAIAAAVFYILTFILATYFMVIVTSFYRQLRDGSNPPAVEKDA